MEKKSKNIWLKSILVLIGIGIWAIVLQNAGVIPTNQDVKVVNTVKTYVNGGDLDANVTGNVNVDNIIDINIRQILGAPAAAYGGYTDKYGIEHYSLGVN